ncbi:MAG TPA: HAMP domain-containing protein, partial [Polyangiaceae bacterium]
AGFLAAWVIARSLGRRLGAIAAATRAVAGGDLSVAALDDPSADEVGQLARAFNAMSANLRDLLQRIRDAGARETERLDALVRARTDELDARNRDMRLVLDNVSQGLLVLDRHGRPGTEQSAVVERWFGKVAAGATFWELIAPLDRRAALDFQLNWDQLLEGCLPTELAVEQLPRTLRAGVLEYQLEYTPLLAAGEAVERVLVVISDVTERRLAERTQAEQYEIVRSFERLTKDRTGFLEFMSDAAALVDRLCSVGPHPLADVRRWLHTLKGNASLFGLIRLATFCHELEDQIEDTGEHLSDAASAGLRAQWDGFAVRIESLMGETKPAAVALGDAEYQAFFEALSAGRPRHELARMVAEWKLESASERLARHASQARSLLLRLGNGGVEVSVDGGRVRLSREAMAPFWGVFGHAVRNAIAHGLELPGERVVVGKRGTGSLRLRAAREGERVIIEIGDDGRGIDWERVRERARAAGIPAETSADLHAALFHDGLSTKDAADGEAGRGIGMGALRAECERLGGRVNVTSTQGRGTTLRFVFPADRVAENEETRLSCVTALRPPAGAAMETGRIASGA